MKSGTTMYGLSIEEAILFAKVLAYAMGDRSISLSQLDKGAAFDLLKKMADCKWNWTEAQKEQYKCLVEICKQSL